MTTTFSNCITSAGSSQRKWNVDRDGRPFGQIWTFKAKGETHPYHAKPLRGEHATFSTLAAAKRHMELI